MPHTASLRTILDIRAREFEQARRGDRRMNEEASLSPVREIAKEAVTLSRKIRQVIWFVLHHNTLILVGLGLALIPLSVITGEILLGLMFLPMIASGILGNIFLHTFCRSLSEKRRTELEKEAEGLQHRAIDTLGIQSLAPGFWSYAIAGEGRRQKALPSGENEAASV